MTLHLRPFIMTLTRDERRRLQPVKDDVKQGVLGGEYDGEITKLQFRRLAFFAYLWRKRKDRHDGS